jgi:hypothetical protein
MQRYTMFFIVVSAVQVSSGFVVTARLVESELLAVTTNKSDEYPMLHVQFLST